MVKRAQRTNYDNLSHQREIKEELFHFQKKNNQVHLVDKFVPSLGRIPLCWSI